MIVVRNQNIVSCERGTNTTYAANELNQYTSIVGGPAESEPEFDDDGNQTLIRTATGLWRVTYNGENRPVLWTCLAACDPIATNGETIAMSYDRMGRRVAKNDQRFVCDGYLQICNLHSQSQPSTPTFDFIWDPTESVATRPLVLRRDTFAAYYTVDGNKNVSDIIAVNGDVAAHYEYAPFGALTFSRSTSAAANTWRFSSECADNEIDVVGFCERSYSSLAGRWMRRDSIEEDGGANIYCFVHNSAVDNFDVLGLFEDGYELVCLEWKWEMAHVGHGERQLQRVCKKWLKKPTEFRGHYQFDNLVDVPEKCKFDYTLEDRSWWSRPENVITGTWRHFRKREEVAPDLDKAIINCDPDGFQRYMHQYQDTYVHRENENKKNYRAPFGHIWDSIWGRNPDHDEKAWKAANIATQKFLEKWEASCRLCDKDSCCWGKQ